jgi:selenocysteine lyase/cysteine desulfurase
MASLRSVMQRQFAVSVGAGAADTELGHGPGLTGNETSMPLYFDNQATTPVDPRVTDKMLPYITSNFGNPHSRSHPYGWTTEEACEEARA